MTPESNKIEQLTQSNYRVFVVTTGSGAGLQQLLWKQPGSSNYLVGAAFPYSTEQIGDFIGYVPEKRVNPGIALDLAIAAYMKADNGDLTKRPIGVGITAVVATTKEHRGDHRIHGAVVTRDAVYASDVVLLKGSGKIAREADGYLTDIVGYELLLMGAGLMDLHEMTALRVMSDKLLRDVSKEARERFLERPLVSRYGQRLLAPQGGVKLFPGAFNPPHEGHFANGGEDVIFQISANPPHKPALSLQEMLGRVRLFKGKRDVLFSEGLPLYIDKARQFPNSTFILGTDALQRMLDPKWGHEVYPLLEEFERLGTNFLVGSRDNDDLHTIYGAIPIRFSAMFKHLPRTPFASLSSTQIREASAKRWDVR